MSWWDIFIVFMLALAIFRGYQTGLGSRLSGWVGLIIAAACVIFKLDTITNWLDGLVDGKAKMQEWLVDYFNARGPAAATGADDFINTWLDKLQLPPAFSDQLSTALQEASSDVYQTVYGEIANIMAQPLWNLLVFLTATIVVAAVLVICGWILHKLMRTWHILDLIDRFAGALISGITMMVVIGAFSALALFILPESTTLGAALHQSFMAPMLEEALNVIIRGGLTG